MLRVVTGHMIVFIEQQVLWMKRCRLTAPQTTGRNATRRTSTNSL